MKASDRYRAAESVTDSLAGLDTDIDREQAAEPLAGVISNGSSGTLGLDSERRDADAHAAARILTRRRDGDSSRHTHSWPQSMQSRRQAAWRFPPVPSWTFRPASVSDHCPAVGR